MPDTIFDLTAALFRAYWNEIALDQKESAASDPVKFRFGAWSKNVPGYLGAVGMDILEGDESQPRRLEKGFIGFKIDSVYDETPLPMIEIFLQRRTDTEDDADLLRAMTLTSKYAIFYVDGKPALTVDKDGIHGNFVGFDPAQPPPSTNLTPAQIAAIDALTRGEFHHPDGLHWFVMQDDGNLVCYRNQIAFDYHTGVPYWASNTVGK